MYNVIFDNINNNLYKLQIKLLYPTNRRQKSLFNGFNFISWIVMNENI